MGYEKLEPKGSKHKGSETMRQKRMAKAAKARAIRMASKKITFLVKRGDEFEKVVVDPSKKWAWWNF